MKKIFCTLFDLNYLPHALALRDSLVKYNPDAFLLMFCMDTGSLDIIESYGLSNIKAISINQFEEWMPALKMARSGRSNVEYFYTCSPAICKYAMEHYIECEYVTYLDSDLFFYGPYDAIFDEINDASIAIIPHNFSFLALKDRKYGIFNVGWVGFRNDEIGISCINKWYEDCLKWCHQRLEDGKYADQKYLDYWPDKYKSLKIITNKGVNLAPWNVSKFCLKHINGTIYVDNDPLVFYHFAGFKQIKSGIYKTNLSQGFIRTEGVLKNMIYIPYFHKLHEYSRQVKIEKKPDLHLRGTVKCIVNLKRFALDLLFNDIINVNK